MLLSVVRSKLEAKELDKEDRKALQIAEHSFESLKQAVQDILDAYRTFKSKGGPGPGSQGSAGRAVLPKGPRPKRSASAAKEFPET